MNLLFLPIIPLVFASVVIGVTRIGGMGNLGRIGGKTVGYFLITTLFAAVIGLGLVNLIRPGDQLPKAQQARLSAKYGKESADKVEAGKKKPFGIDTFVNIIPSNPLKEFVNKDNMLAVIFTSILVGIALTQIDPSKAARIVEFLEGVNQVAEYVIRLAMKCAPLGVFMLMFSTTALFGYQLLVALLAFVLTVLGGLAVHSFVVLPLLVWLLGGINPIQFYVKSFPSLATAFSTSSSSATLPTAIKNATDDLGVPPTVAQFVLPLSASMNHNGTALFESVVVLFLVQVFGVDLTIGQQIIVLVLCVLTATGMAGVPGGSLPLIGMVLETATEGKVPGAAIAIVLGVDRLLDMCRTTVNVAADLTTAVFVARTEKGQGGV
jgi:DAACS family dicarboxylate/amino acid:cation (Na+ or H+) symporter